MADLKLIKELRETTGAGILDAKNALDNSNNDMEKAIEWLRINGISKAVKKLDRIAAEGIVWVKQTDSKISLIEVNSETDYVASNEKFLKAVNDIMNESIKHNIENQEDLLLLKIENSTVKEILTNLIATIGEKISIRRYVAFETTSIGVSYYQHSNNRIATIVMSNDKNESVELLRDVAMHITALNPKFAYKDEIDEEFIKKEKAVVEEKYRELHKGKPENIIQNIINGALNKELSELILTEQFFVKNSSKKVGDLFPNSKIKFIRYEVGEGIQKLENNFAQEVMDQVNKKSLK